MHSHCRGHGFESHMLHQQVLKATLTGCFLYQEPPAKVVLFSFKWGTQNNIS